MKNYKMIPIALFVLLPCQPAFATTFGFGNRGQETVIINSDEICKKADGNFIKKSGVALSEKEQNAIIEFNASGRGNLSKEIFDAWEADQITIAANNKKAAPLCREPSKNGVTITTSMMPSCNDLKPEQLEAASYILEAKRQPTLTAGGEPAKFRYAISGEEMDKLEQQNTELKKKWENLNPTPRSMLIEKCAK